MSLFPFLLSVRQIQLLRPSLSSLQFLFFVHKALFMFYMFRTHRLYPQPNFLS
uniref:Uncharacterized protein n=1 Tax=Anguilla anguilla TaxID=7936 RepID=A0A0E9SL21_ANGAN